ncbi:MAG TPA: PRC-barrel domain-containing protein [Usitatibacteraceae bacterium]|nr:PRC-barrel domain-containing protein [Usitatibacteraceae bacterium]
MTQRVDTVELIAGSKVTGTTVYSEARDKIGEIDDLIIDKVSGQVIYAVMSFGGFLGMGEKYHPLPWNILTYDTEKEGYVIPLAKDLLKDAPAMTKSELEELSVGDVGRTQIFTYYSPYGAERYW